MRKGLFAALFAAAAMMVSLVGCNQPKLPDSVAINNKEAMQAEWFGDNEARTLNLTVKKAGNEINALEAITKGDLLITSSNTSVATISGLKVNPVDGDGGKSTITVTYGSVSDNVEVTVTKANKHGKIPTDPFTVAEAIAVCEETGTTSTIVEYYVKGVVTKVNSAWSDKYGNITFEIGDKKTDKKVVQCYRLAAGPDVDMDILKKLNKGSEVLVVGTLVNYKGTTPEVNQGGKVLSCTEGDKEALTLTGPEALATVEAGVEYFAGAVQQAIPAVLFADGKLTSNRLTSITFADGVSKFGKFSFEAVEGGYSLKVGSKYLNAKADGTSFKLYDEDAATSVWTWNETAKTVKTLVGEETIYIASYQAYNTFSASKASYVVDDQGKVKDGQFPIQFYAKFDGTTVAPTAAQTDQSASVEVGEQTQLSILANPFNADLSQITWESSDETIVTVANGIITGVAVGKATIRLKLGNDATVVDTCAVTVDPAIAYESLDVAIAATSFTADPSDAKIATFTSGIATFKLDQNTSSTANRLSDADHLRVYKNAKFGVAITGGKLGKVQFTVTAASYASADNFTNLPKGSTVIAQDKVVTIKLPDNITSFDFVAGNQVRISNAKLFYLPANA